VNAESFPIPEGNLPEMSVVLSTRDRSGMASRCIASILENHAINFELLVVDQSADHSLKLLLQEFAADSRLRYLAAPILGLSAGRNFGIGQARSDLIACTDDDCRVPTDWLEQMKAALMVDSRIAAVYGNMIPAERHLPDGFIAGRSYPAPFIAKTLRDQHRVDGMAGSMGIRRSAWKQLCGFDELLGAGARFCSAEDLDFSIRALSKGYFVHATPGPEVVHYGFRSWAEGKYLIRGYLYGIGAMFAKHIKCGNWSILHYLMCLARRWTYAGPVVEFGHTPSRWLRLKAFASGFAAAMSVPVLRETLLFRK
jgi:GT2 family glycosyltransferase